MLLQLYMKIEQNLINKKADVAVILPLILHTSKEFLKLR